MGLYATHIRNEARRDRLLMLLAIAQALLTLLGAASECSGTDTYLKVNTVKRRHIRCSGKVRTGTAASPRCARTGSAADESVR